MPNITLPINLDFERWANQLRVDLPNMNIPISRGEDNWREWANQIINANPTSNIPIPTETGYPQNKDWRQWAIYFYQVMQQ